MFLAGDIGGTKTVLALYRESDGEIEPAGKATYPSRSYATFGAILSDFLKGPALNLLRSACFGVAGMVVDGRSHTTNLPWELDERTLANEIGVSRVKLLNDLETTAYGMLHLRPDQACALQAGGALKRKGHVAVIAAGTGLGEAMLFWDGELYHPIASEGGHSDFGPNNALEVELWQYLSETLKGHVSWERVLSGPGFLNLYRFLRDTGHETESPELAERLKQGDPNPTIAALGVAGTDPLCAATVELFCSIYGSEAGNVALRSVAVGGVFIGGGIAPKILPALQKEAFSRAFCAKGRFHDFLRAIPVSVSLNPEASLIGAAQYARRL
jgi:glucokinase